MGLGDDPLAKDAHGADHQQPQVADDVGGERLVGDVGALDVEPEVAALQAPAVRDVHLEVELRSFLFRGRGVQGQSPFMVSERPPHAAAVRSGPIEWTKLARPAAVEGFSL